MTKKVFRRLESVRSGTCNTRLRLENLENRYMLTATSADAISEMQIESVNADSVLNALAADQETAYLQEGVNGLRVAEIREHAVGHAVTFQQTVGSQPVYGGIVTALVAENGDIEQVYAHGIPHVHRSVAMGPLLQAADAESVAVADFGTADVIAESEQVWFAAGREAELAWQVTTFADSRNYRTLISVENGAILNQESFDKDYYTQFETEFGVYPRIVINNNIGAAGSRAYATSNPAFESTVEMSTGCTAVLIAPDVILSARHCGGGANTQFHFGPNSIAPVYTATAASRILPAGGGSLLDGGDVAIFPLTAPVPSSVAEPMRLIEGTDDLEGQLSAMLGYGYNGLGSSGHGFNGDPFRWGGENIIDVYGSPAAASGTNIISTDFDNGTSAANTIGGSDPNPVEFEATTAPGDSGGPIMVQTLSGEWVVAGVLSGGTTSTSVYGDISWWTGVAPYRDDIEAVGGEFLGGGVGRVNFDESTYAIGDAVEITVRDPNAVTPVMVTVTSDSGDSETVTLANSGTNLYSATIATSGSGVSNGDGTLQVSLFDGIEVTYQDPDDGQGNPLTATDTADIGNVTHFETDDLPVAIQDLQTVTSDLEITDAGTIVDLDVQLSITHTWDSDLDVFLRAPDGTRIELFSDVGGDGNNFDDTILDDEADTSIGSGGAPFAGSFQPEGNLGALDGMSITGTWTLEIFDDFAQDQGTLTDWCLFINVQGGSPSGDFNGDGAYSCEDINALTTAIFDGTDDPAFDLTGDGSVDLDDRDAWLLEAGEANLGPGRSYLVGDANLDGLVDGNDFIIWNANRFQSSSNWCDGDFNADGVVDGGDFILWNSNRFQSSDSVFAALTPSTSATEFQAGQVGVKVAEMGQRNNVSTEPATYQVTELTDSVRGQRAGVTERMVDELFAVV